MYTGPNTQNDGLIFGYDADERSSRFYKGEPTTNLFPDITGQISKYNISQYSGKQDNQAGVYNYYTTTHGVYTLSADLRLYSDDTATYPRFSIQAYYSDGTQSYVNKVSIKDDILKKVVVTLSTDTTKTLVKIYGWVFDYSTPGTTRHCDAYNIQLEQKSHATEFVNGSNYTTNLIDLKRTTSIDLTNVSFNWKGSPYFYAGGNNVISIPDSTVARFPHNSPWSMTMVFKVDNFKNTYPGLIRKGSSGPSSVGFLIYYGSNRTIYVKHNNVTTTLGSFTSFGTYQEITLTYTGSGNVKGYINGVFTGTQVALVGTEVTSDLTIGRGDEFGANCIVIFRKYNKELTASEVLQNYNASKGRFEEENRLNEGLVLHLDANNKNSYPGTGTTWYDLAGANNGTLANGPTFNTVGDGSVVFDGIDDSMYIDLSTSMNDMYSKELTLTTVAMQTATNDADGWLFDLDFVGYRLWGYANAAFWVRGPSAGWDGLYWTFNLNQWYHLTATFIDDGSTNNAKIYVNGQLYAQQTIAIKNIGPYSGVNYARMASHFGGGNSKPFKVGMFQKYKRALSAQEIATHYNKYKDRFGL